MQRSLIERSQLIVDLPFSYKLTIPDIVQSDLVFENSKYFSEDDLNDNDAINIKATHPGKK
jgi:hypothetical protein